MDALTDVLDSIIDFFDNVGTTWNELLSPTARMSIFGFFCIFTFLLLAGTYKYPFYNTGEQHETAVFLYYLLFACSAIPSLFQWLFSLLGDVVDEIGNVLMGMVYTLIFGSLLFALGAYSPEGIADHYLVSYVFCFLGLLIMAVVSFFALLGLLFSVFKLSIPGARGQAVAALVAFSAILSPAAWAGYSEYIYRDSLLREEAKEYAPAVNKYMNRLEAEYQKQYKRGLTGEEYNHYYLQRMKDLVLAGRQEKLLQQEANIRELREKYGAANNATKSQTSHDPQYQKNRSRQFRDKWKRWLLWSELDKQASHYKR